MSRRAAGVPVLASFLLLVALMCASGVARAQFTPTGAADRKVDPEADVRRIRSGLVISLMGGVGLSKSSGYPNNYNQIGDPDFYSSSNVLVGGSGGAFLGGALTDYLNFG